MSKFTALDIVRRLSCDLNDKDCVAIIEFLIGHVHKSSTIFKVEKLIIAAAKFERNPV